MKLIQIFRAGSHRSMAGNLIEFTESDLQVAAHAYNAHADRAPAVLCIGHPPDNSPSYGLVHRLVAAAGKLFAEVDPNEQLRRLVRSGAYKKVSAAFLRQNHPRNPVPGSYFLRHIGFLGAATPAVKGMLDPVFAEGGDQLCFADGSASGAPADLDEMPVRIGIPAGYSVAPEALDQYRRVLALSLDTGLSFADSISLMESYGGC